MPRVSLEKLQKALDRATQPSVKAELRKRIARASGGTTKNSSAAFAEAEAMAARRRKAAAKRR